VTAIEGGKDKSMIEDALWTCISNARHSAGVEPFDGIDLSDLLRDAGRARRLPGDAEMEKLERKATIARALYGRYSRDWVPQKASGKAPTEMLVGVAALLLLDAFLAADRARALKRLNAALWVMEFDDWHEGVPATRELAALAERLVGALSAAPT
jgi:hypothetical protein